MVANTLTFVCATVLSFFLTPFITSKVGIEAYGLVALAGSFVSYITLFTAALNSMASRFIIIEIHQDNYGKANEYFSSVLIANAVIAIILILPAIWLILNLDKINVSQSLMKDAQITFSIIILSFFINSVGAFFGIVLYARNILYKGSFRSLESNIFRVVLILLLFSFLDTRIYYVTLSAFIAGLYPLIWNIHYTKKYIPKLQVHIKSFSKKAIRTLISAGVWNSVTKLSHILLDGLDLLLCNLFLGGVMTGNLSVAKTLPGLFISLIAVISDSYIPTFYSLYAKNQKSDLLSSINSSINILSTISGIIISLLIIYSSDFYRLWLPKEDNILLSSITIVSLGTVLSSCSIYSIFSIFSLTNKVKFNSIVMVISGAISIILNVISLKFTTWGVFAIVGSTAFVGLLRNLLFTPIYAAHCLALPRYTFYKRIGINYINLGVLIFIYYIIRQLYIPNDWLSLFGSFVGCGVIGLIASWIIVIPKYQRITIKERVVSRLHKSH